MQKLSIYVNGEFAVRHSVKKDSAEHTEFFLYVVEPSTKYEFTARVSYWASDIYLDAESFVTVEAYSPPAE